MTPERSGRGIADLTASESLALAATVPVGRLAFVHDGRLHVVPVAVLVEAADVVVRTGDGTELLDAARAAVPAVLELDDLVDWSRSGWSVLVRGALREVVDPDEVARLLDSGPQPWAGPGRDHVVRLVGDEVTGRRIHPGAGGTTWVQG